MSCAERKLPFVALADALAELRAAAARIGRLRGARAEESLYGDFQAFLSRAAAELGAMHISVVPQMTQGRLVPDYGLFRSDDHIGWVELKAPDKDLDGLRGHDAEQLARALEDLEAFVLTNGWAWRLYLTGRLEASAEFPQSALRDPQEAITDANLRSLGELLERVFSRAPSAIVTADEATRLMAFRARTVKRHVLEEMTAPPAILQGLYEEFEGLVYKSGREYSRDDFADAYAQTAVFGLLLARLSTGALLTLATAAAGIAAEQHPFLFRCLSIMTDHSLSGDLRVVLQEALTTINRIPPRIFQRRAGRDPLLYAYEDFFAVYDPDERAGRGVYYTPPYVVGYQVNGIERLLRDEFGFSGLTDPAVRFLDPATGTGTYLLGLLEQAQAEVADAGGAEDVELGEMIINRVRAFELMVGPYTVAHQRVSTFLQNEAVDISARLPIYLVDTLAEALAGTVQSRFGPLGEEIAHEREAAEHVKSSEPILVVLGNPPYDRIRRDQLGDHWLLDRINDMIERTPKADRRQIHPIYDFYVAFWRWALWLVAERTGELAGRGIVSYITNRSWLVGRTFGGMRALFTERCRTLYVLDLGGDLRTSGTRATDQNVFDIGVGVAIVFAVVDATNDEPAAVYYRRQSGSRANKEAFLTQPFEPAGFELVERHDPIAPLIPVGWGVLDSSPSIDQLFAQHETGVQTSRDALVVGVRPDDLLLEGPGPLGGSIGEWSSLTEAERDEVFHTTTTHPSAPAGEPTSERITPYAYRPLDYRHIYNDPRFIHRPRPGLQRAFSRPNLALVTIERGFGAGPAAFPVNALPDLHVFRGFGGSRGIYPLYGEPSAPRRRSTPAADQLSLSDEIALARTLTDPVLEWARSVLDDPTPEDIFAYICAVLGAPAYVVEFEERGLIAERPRVPLTSDANLAREAVRIGCELVALWTLQAPILAEVRWAPGRTANQLGEATYDAATNAIAVAGRKLEGVTPAVWDYEVSGLRVLRRYFEDRAQHTSDAAMLDQVRRVVSAVRGIVEWEPALDELLKQMLAGELQAV